MAQKVQVLLVDDIDGGDADQTVEFGLDGVAYEIDLSAKNADKLRNALAGYVGVARKVGQKGGGRRRGGGRSRSAGSGPSAKDVREWAKANGHDVSDRGRVSAEVMEAYEAAH